VAGFIRLQKVCKTIEYQPKYDTSFSFFSSWKRTALAFFVFVSAFDVDILLMMKQND